MSMDGNTALVCIVGVVGFVVCFVAWVFKRG